MNWLNFRFLNLALCMYMIRLRQQSMACGKGAIPSILTKKGSAWSAMERTFILKTLKLPKYTGLKALPILLMKRWYMLSKAGMDKKVYLLMDLGYLPIP